MRCLKIVIVLVALFLAGCASVSKNQNSEIQDLKQMIIEKEHRIVQLQETLQSESAEKNMLVSEIEMLRKDLSSRAMEAKEDNLK